MADWYLKYYYEFKDERNNQPYKVEIYEDVVSPPAPAPTEIKADFEPCVINYRNNELYNPVWASGAELSILSTSDRQFFSLYTDDMMKYMVKVYKGTDLFWIGYLDSENYEEDFSFIDNYSVNITANDGFNLLDRLYYTNYDPVLDTTTNYTGIESMWVIVQRILQKINLPWNNIHIGLSTTLSGITFEQDKSLLEYIYVNNENFYNEDNEPETCRVVLEHILQIFGAFIIQLNGDLIITDSNYLSTGAPLDFYPLVSFKTFKYGYETTEYTGTTILDLQLGDISNIGNLSTSFNFNIEAGTNKQVLVYSPYDDNIVLDYISEGDFSETGYTIENNAFPEWSYQEVYYNSGKTWTKSNNGYFVKQEGTGLKNQDIYFYGLKIEPFDLNYYTFTGFTGGTERLCFEIEKELPELMGTNNYKLKLEIKCYPRSSSYFGYIVNKADSLKIKEIQLHADIIYENDIGSSKYIYNLPINNTFQWNEEWVDISATGQCILNILSPDLNDYWLENQKFNELNDRDCFLKKYNLSVYSTEGILKEEPFYIPLGNLANGKIKIKIYDYIFRLFDNSWITGYNSSTYPYTLFIKDIKLTIVDSDGNEVSRKDIEYVSNQNKKFKNEGSKIVSYLGTNVDEHPYQKGNLLLKSVQGFYYYLSQTEKEGLVDIPEKLLLRSIKSNYGFSAVKLSVDLPLQHNLGYLEYKTYLSGKKLLIMSNRMDLATGISSLTIREFKNDYANIIE
jgi:hypothetical protein